MASSVRDKAALAVLRGKCVVLVRFAPAVSISVGPVHLDLGVVVGGVGKDAAPLDLQLKEGLIGRCIVEFSVINGVDVAVFAVAAQFKVRVSLLMSCGFLTFQAGSAQGHHVDGVSAE